MRLFRPLYHKPRKHSFKCDVLLWKTLFRVSIKFLTYQDRFDNKYFYLKTSKTFVQVETNKVLNESGVENRHLVAEFENNVVPGSRFEWVCSVIASANRQKPRQTSETSSTCFLNPNAPLGPIVTWVSSQEPPQKWFSFRKGDERGWKSTLSTFPLKEIS